MRDSSCVATVKVGNRNEGDLSSIERGGHQDAWLPRRIAWRWPSGGLTGVVPGFAVTSDNQSRVPNVIVPIDLPGAMRRND